MTINELLEKKNMTKYRLAKNTKLPYTTVNDICSGKAHMEKCSAETIYRIAKELDVSMESLIEPCLEPRVDFELFKSNVCHRLKERGDIGFIIEILEADPIRGYYRKKQYPECLYLLAMLDYVSRENDIPLCEQYDDLRGIKLKTVLFPAGIRAEAYVTKNDEVKRKAIEDSIPEFIRFNIVESEVRDVI